MKKYFFILAFLFLPFSAFAGADTDRICADEVAYEVGIVSVDSPNGFWKYSTSDGDILYYIINTNDSKNPSITMQSELYKYNCHTKKEKLLTIVPVDAECEFYTINSIATDKINKKYRNILMRRYQCSADVGGTLGVIVYNERKNSPLFHLKNTEDIFPASEIDGFIDGVGSWYLYFAHTYTENDVPVLFRIDKKTKKITKL